MKKMHGRQPSLPENDCKKALGMVDVGMSVADVLASSNMHK